MRGTFETWFKDSSVAVVTRKLDGVARQLPEPFELGAIDVLPYRGFFARLGELLGMR